MIFLNSVSELRMIFAKPDIAWILILYIQLKVFYSTFLN